MLFGGEFSMLKDNNWAGGGVHSLHGRRSGVESSVGLDS